MAGAHTAICVLGMFAYETLIARKLCDDLVELSVDSLLCLYRTNDTMRAVVVVVVVARNSQLNIRTLCL